ncbi:MAG: HAMP domain-containing sensor histidine kinase [Actinomycetota bacterium]|nr:HAMP domain-containing sensor histidine kinase [Actinomycetota bacterium]
MRDRGGLKWRIALAFAAVAALTAALAAVILSQIWQNQFEEYVREDLQQTADGAAELLGRSYALRGGWTMEAFSPLPRFGMMSGLALQVVDSGGTLLYDDSTMSGHTTAVHDDGTPLVPDEAAEPEGPVVTSPIAAQGEIVGSIRLWSYTPAEGLLSENDIAFRKRSFGGLSGAAVLAVVLASFAGILYALRLVRPIDRITDTARALRGGDTQARTGMSGGDAIGTLGRTFDEMADAIEADRELERRLTADVAHELRTPLQAIQATVEAMQDGVLPADSERLGIVRDETMRLSRLANGILELTRLERGAIGFASEPLDLAAPVGIALDSHQILIEDSGLALSKDIAQGLMVLGDTDRLTQAVANLLSNAARYTPSGGQVSVRVAQDGDRAFVQVSDTGNGIAPDDMAHVFSRFWRADSARASSSGGLGIGLSVVREIVERHGGSVAVEPAEGGGTTFTMWLPLVPTKGTKASRGRGDQGAS